MPSDKPAPRPTRDETSANLLRLGKLLNDLAFPERGIVGRPNRPCEIEQLKAEIQALEKGIEQAVYDQNQRLLRSALDIRGDQVVDLIALRILAYVAWGATHLDRPSVPVARVCVAEAMGDMGAHLEARKTIRQMIISEKGLRYRDSEFSSGELLLGLRMVKYISTEGHLMVLWSSQTIEEEKEQWRRQQEASSRRTSPPRDDPRPVLANPTAQPSLTACDSPKAIFEALRRTVIGIDPVVRRFSVQMAMHMRRVAIADGGGTLTTPPVCVLLCGASGCGKSFLASEFGRLSNLPFAVGDMASVTASAYVGTSVDELLFGFAKKGAKLADAQKGILFLDEIDKKRTNNRNGDFDATGVGVQYELLRMLEGARIQIGGKRGNDSLPRGAIDTTTMAFILAGAFSDISVRLRDSAKARAPLGFSGGNGASGVPPDVRELLLGYFIPELVNRIGSVIVIPPPSLTQLEQIMTAPTGIIARQNQFLVAFGIRISPSPEAIREMASWALETKTFARGMRSLCQTLVEEAIFEERKGEVAIGIQEVRKAIEGLRQEPECLKS